jgi:hypothetical protein
MSARCRAERTRRIAGLILTAVCFGMLPVYRSAAQTRCPFAAQRSGGGPSGGGSVKAPPAKVTQVRIVDSSGNVAYEMLKDAKAIERRGPARDGPCLGINQGPDHPRGNPAIGTEGAYRQSSVKGSSVTT